MSLLRDKKTSRLSTFLKMKYKNHFLNPVFLQLIQPGDNNMLIL